MPRSVSAQTRPGTLRLVVRDATDLAIPGATVTLTSASGTRRNAVANERGEVLFNITTGLDENRDGQTNERPLGVGRNAGRGEPTANVDMGIVWERSIGQRVRLNAQRGGGGGRDGGGNNRVPERIFRFEIFARATNVLNLVNAQNFSGVVTSPFFGRATSAVAPRRLVLGMRAFF
jgi:hypothetical protein